MTRSFNFKNSLRDLGFERAIACDTEYNFGVDGAGEPLDGNPLRPVCICAKDLISDQTWEIWLDGSPRRYKQPPFPIDKSTLLIAYNASAEIRTFKALGWQDPVREMDDRSLCRKRVSASPAQAASRASRTRYRWLRS
jgi:hypothetical protein